jgi:hypothetical protein
MIQAPTALTKRYIAKIQAEYIPKDAASILLAIHIVVMKLIPLNNA